MTSPERNQLPRERQYLIDQVTAQYEAELRAGRAPRLEDYLRQHPEFADELTRFALYLQTVDRQEPQLDAVPAPALSPAAQAALASIARAERVSIASLIKQAGSVGLTPTSLAAAVGLSADILAKLESRAVAAATIPPTLVRRLADALGVAPRAVQSYLDGQATVAGAFYYAERAPTRSQESFASAIRKSGALGADRKAEWLAIVQREVTEA